MNTSAAPTAEHWAAPTPGRPVDVTVTLPGSKSLTNRALALAALGAEIDSSRADWHVTPGPLRGPASVDCGLAGTVMRFVPPVAALAEGVVEFDGDPYARERPMNVILGALRT